MRNILDYFKTVRPILAALSLLNMINIIQAFQIQDLEKENMFYKEIIVYNADLQTDMLEAMTYGSIKIVDEYCIETEKKKAAEAKGPYTYGCIFNSGYAYNEYKKIVDANNYIVENVQVLLLTGSSNE